MYNIISALTVVVAATLFMSFIVLHFCTCLNCMHVYSLISAPSLHTDSVLTISRVSLGRFGLPWPRSCLSRHALRILGSQGFALLPGIVHRLPTMAPNCALRNPWRQCPNPAHWNFAIRSSSHQPSLTELRIAQFQSAVNLSGLCIA